MQNNMTFWSLDLEMEQPSNEILSIGVSIWTPTAQHGLYGINTKNFLITPSQPVSEFIQNLTGLKDDQFDWNKTRTQCFQDFADYMHNIQEIAETRWHREPITWGAGDLHLLREQLPKLDKLNFLSRRFIDVKSMCMLERVYEGRSISGKMSLRSGLSMYDMHFEGAAHDSSVDAYNTMRLFRAVVDKNIKKHQLITQLVGL